MSDDDTALFCGRLVAAQEPKMDALKATRSYLTLRALGFSEILNKETRLHFDAKFRPHLTLAVSKPSS
ncbi:MAG: hypothetical protein ACKVPX_02305 [Myxococcaceae bacterium]